MDKPIYQSSSGEVEFLIFQDRLNGLFRFLEQMRSPVEKYVSEYTANIKHQEENIKKGPEYYEIEGLTFTKHKALLGLEFADDYTGGTGNDSDFFPQYFYSSILILAISILEALANEVRITVEEKTKNKFNYKRNSNQPYLIKLLLFFNENGYNVVFDPNIEKAFRRMNTVRNHYVHKLHEGDFGRLAEEELLTLKVTYSFVRSSLTTIALIAQKLEKEFT